MNIKHTNASVLLAAVVVAALPLVPAAAVAEPVRQPSISDGRALTPIQQRYRDEPELRALLGKPVGEEQAEGLISSREYERGWLVYSPATEVREIHGAIADRYAALGGHRVLGVPTTDEVASPDGSGRYNHFAGTGATGPASVYWHPDTGARAVWGSVRDFWATVGWEAGYLGYPTTSTNPTVDGVGEYNHFLGQDLLGASVYWSPNSGPHSIQGEIRDKFASLGGVRGAGYPTTNEIVNEDGIGRYSELNGTDAIYWHPDTGAHILYTDLYAHYVALGREKSYLGYPIRDQRTVAESDGQPSVPADVQVDFQHGYIRMDGATGRITDGRW